MQNAATGQLDISGTVIFPTDRLPAPQYLERQVRFNITGDAPDIDMKKLPKLPEPTNAEISQALRQGSHNERPLKVTQPENPPKPSRSDVPAVVLNAPPPPSPTDAKKLLMATEAASHATVVYYDHSVDPDIQLHHARRVPVTYHPRTCTEYDPRLTRSENKANLMDRVLCIRETDEDTFDPDVWLAKLRETSQDISLYVRTNNGPLAEAPVLGPDPHALYKSDDTKLTILNAPRTHRFGSAPTHRKYSDVQSIAQYKQHGRFRDFVDDLASARIKFMDPGLDSYFLQKARGNVFPVQRDFPYISLPVRNPTSPVERILTCQYDVLADVLDLPTCHVTNYMTRHYNDSHVEPPCDDNPFDSEDINETLKQMATILDLDPELMAPDNPTVKQYMAQFQEEDRRAFQQYATHIDCSNVTDIRIEILIAAKDGKDPTDGAFKLQPDEIPVTKEWIKIDSSQMRDLRNVPPDQRLQGMQLIPTVSDTSSHISHTRSLLTSALTL